MKLRANEKAAIIKAAQNMAPVDYTETRIVKANVIVDICTKCAEPIYCWQTLNTTHCPAFRAK